MTLGEAAAFLSVSRSHVRKLVNSGKLNEVLPREPSGALNIDAASVEKYKAKLDAARRAWLDFDVEDDK
jgi:excisionase family DNA binding protein